MKKELKYLRRQLCRWIVGFDNCPKDYRNNFAMKIAEAISTVIFTIGIICLFAMLIILL